MRREILDMARSTGFEGSILDLYQMANQGANVPAMLQAEAQAKQENMLVAQTPQEQQVGLRGFFQTYQLIHHSILKVCKYLSILQR